MSNTNTSVAAPAPAASNAAAVAAATAYLNKELETYEESAGSDEDASWPQTYWEIESLEMGTHPRKMLVECEVVVSCGDREVDFYSVTVELGADLTPVGHDLDAQIEAACAEDTGDAYTQRAEDGFRDA